MYRFFSLHLCAWNLFSRCILCHAWYGKIYSLNSLNKFVGCLLPQFDAFYSFIHAFMFRQRFVFCHSVLSSFSMYFVSFISVYLCVHNYIYVQKIFRFVYKCIFFFVPLLSATIVQSIYGVCTCTRRCHCAHFSSAAFHYYFPFEFVYFDVQKKKEENERTNQPTNRAHLHKSNNSGVGERIAIVKEKAWTNLSFSQYSCCLKHSEVLYFHLADTKCEW